MDLIEKERDMRMVSNLVIFMKNPLDMITGILIGNYITSMLNEMLPKHIDSIPISYSSLAGEPLETNSSSYWHEMITSGYTGLKAHQVPSSWDMNNSAYSNPDLIGGDNNEPESTFWIMRNTYREWADGIPFLLSGTVDYILTDIANDSAPPGVSHCFVPHPPDFSDHAPVICDFYIGLADWEHYAGDVIS